MRMTTSLAGGVAFLALAAIAVAATPNGQEAQFCQLVEKKKEEPKSKSVSGELQAVESSTLTLIGTGKQSVTLKIDSGTKINVDGKEASLSALTKGQQVTCTYVERQGSNVCLSVTARAGAKE